MKSAISGTLHEKIFSEERNGIDEGIYKLGDKFLTEVEMSDKYNVSRDTASKVLKRLEFEGYIKRKKRVGAIISAKETRRKDIALSRSVIPIILPSNATNVVYEILVGAQDEAAKNDCVVTPYISYDANTAVEREIVEKVLDMDTMGVIVWNCDISSNRSVFSQLLVQNKQLVFLDSRKLGFMTPLITSNNQKAMSDLVSYLCEMGHEDIAFYTVSLNEAPAVADRFTGYVEALTERNIMLKDEYVIEFPRLINESIRDNPHIETATKNASDALRELMSLPTPPTAVICANDLYAVTLMNEAINMGMSIPDDLSITGFDNQQFCEYSQVPITTMAQDFKAMGAKAVEVIQLMQQGERVENDYSFDAVLVERRSVKNLNE